MVLFYLQNSTKMVKKLFLSILFTQFFLLSTFAQKNVDKIELNASLNNDSVRMGDTLEISLSFINVSDLIFDLHLNARIDLIHKENMFIFYNSLERIAYNLQDCSNDSIIYLFPGDIVHYIYPIVVKNSFFYIGENKIVVHYMFWDKIAHKRKKYKTNISLWSLPINLMVY